VAVGLLSLRARARASKQQQPAQLIRQTAGGTAGWLQAQRRRRRTCSGACTGWYRAKGHGCGSRSASGLRRRPTRQQRRRACTCGNVSACVLRCVRVAAQCPRRARHTSRRCACRQHTRWWAPRRRRRCMCMQPASVKRLLRGGGGPARASERARTSTGRRRRSSSRSCSPPTTTTQPARPRLRRNTQQRKCARVHAHPGCPAAAPLAAEGVCALRHTSNRARESAVEWVGQ
jgi:hypothetical protein